VVDDEPNVLAAFEEILGEQGHAVSAVGSAEDALARLETDRFQLVIMDICMPGMNGLDALERVRASHPRVPVIIMTAHGTMDTAVEATKRGAFDYQLKPFDPGEMLQTVDKALEAARLMEQPVELDPNCVASGADAMIGRSPAMQHVYKALGRVAPTDATVLIRGESGTGKELVARAVYQHSRRNERPLLTVNCAAIPETLLESELFGYERGAFTGAVARKIGKFEQAHAGTIFLDEIGDIPLSVQAKILRVLQGRTFERLGGNETIEVDVRLLAATNRNLEKSMAEGTFREDLYHRLNVVTVSLPPLRERREDIPRLVDYFVDRTARDLKIDRPAIAPDALARIADYPWPGNVRELKHCIERLLILTGGHPVQAVDLQPILSREAAASPLRPSGSAPLGHRPLWNREALGDLVEEYLAACGGPGTHERFLEAAERLLLAEALRRTRGNRTHAARLLGLPRPTLHAKMVKYKLADPSERDRPVSGS
jgi:nitrogen regulation protein NR(I)